MNTVCDEKRYQVLIVDDSSMNRAILEDILCSEYGIIEAVDGGMAVNLLEHNRDSISCVLLDINMPGVNGFGVLDIMQREGWVNDTPVIMISAENSRDVVEHCYDLGATDYISRPFDAFIVRRRVANTIALYEKQKKLEDMVVDQMYKNEKDNRMMISILSHIVEFRNGESGSHIKNISTITAMMLERLVEISDEYNLTAQDIAMISTASALHDIGKISVPSKILNKPGRLTGEEFEVMKQHSMIGADMLRSLDQSYKSEELLEVAYQICRWHHERYDGHGYPDGLTGEEIPIAAQVVSLSDVYDALTSERCYKCAYSHETAMNMILNGECGQFNPLLLRCLEDIAPDIEEKLDAEEVTHHNKAEIQAIAEEIMRKQGSDALAN